MTLPVVMVSIKPRSRSPPATPWLPKEGSARASLVVDTIQGVGSGGGGTRVKDLRGYNELVETLAQNT